MWQTANLATNWNENGFFPVSTYICHFLAFWGQDYSVPLPNVLGHGLDSKLPPVLCNLWHWSRRRLHRLVPTRIESIFLVPPTRRSKAYYGL